VRRCPSRPQHPKHDKRVPGGDISGREGWGLGMTWVFDLYLANSNLLLKRGSTNPRLPQISWVLRFPSIGRVSAPWAGAEVACCGEYAYAFDQSFWSN
jgi:hypothetical protein